MLKQIVLIDSFKIKLLTLNTKPEINICWLRRDLRLEDNAALYYALKSNLPVQVIFIFDTEILEKLTNKKDKRVDLLHQVLNLLNNQLVGLGSELKIFHGKPTDIWQQIITDNNVKQVFTNHDYEQYAIKRDQNIAELLSNHQIQFHTYKDQCVFEKNEVLKDDGTPYTVFTPYKNKWYKTFTDYQSKEYPTEKYFNNFYQTKSQSSFITLKDLGFEKTEFEYKKHILDIEIVKNYAEKRDFPAINGTSRLSMHLRFGTISVRKLVKIGQKNSETWLNELIWRDFYMMILWHFPHVSTRPFRLQYENIEWINNEDQYQKWCDGKTGYPIVDAGMRELNQTGFMHNRVRMIVASFLTKHLLIDYKWGEAYFAQKLMDFDLSANNGGWQWAAGCGCDAAPYFRVFSPALQTQKFDPKLVYIKKWIPEINQLTYPQPIVDHDFARKRAVETYKKGLNAV